MFSFRAVPIIGEAIDTFSGEAGRRAGETQKRGMTKASGDIRASGQKIAGMYNWAGAQQERDIWDPAQKSLGYYRDTYLSNKPTQAGEAYETVKNRQPATSSAASLYYGTAGKSPRYVRDAYGNYVAPTSGSTAYSARRTNGYTPSAVTRRRVQRESAGPTDFDRYLTQRRGEGTEAEYLRGVTDKLGNTRYASERTDALASALRSGGGDSGRFLSELKSGNTSAGRLLDRTGDYSETFGVGDTYDAVARETERPGYSEEFYLSAIEGENPAYEQLKSDFTADARRAAAARGGFVSGKAMDVESRGLTRLAGEEYERRGMLAGQADQARNARLGTRVGAATAYDQAVLGNKSYLADLSKSIDQMAADLSMSRDELVAQLASQGDISQQQARGLMLEGAKAVDASERADRDALDALSIKGGDLGLARERDIDALTTKEADDIFAREQALDALGYKDDENTRANYTNRRELAEGATKEEMDYLDLRGRLAKNADTSRQADDDIILRGGQQASGEQQKYLDGLNQFADREFETARARSISRQAHDMASIGALASSDISAIEIELQRSGVDAATAQAYGNMLMGLIKAGIEGYKASQTGGAA